MPGFQNLDTYNQPSAGHEPHDETGLFEEPDKLLQVSLAAEGLTDANRRVRDIASWRLRVSKRQTNMFRLRRSGELAMSTTIALLGTYAAAQSLGEGRIEGAAISFFAIIWSFGVGREAIRDFNSQEYTNLAKNTAQERMYHNATMASLELSPEL